MKLTSLIPLLVAFLAPLPFTTVSADPVLTYSADGNPIAYTGSGSAIATGTTAQFASFTAPESFDATGLNLDFSVATTTAFTYGIELANAGGTGPSGTYVDSGTFSGTTTTTGYEDFSLPTYQLTAGTVYYVVVTPTTGSTDIHEDSGFTPSLTQPYGYSDSNFERGSVSTGNYNAPTSSTTTALNYVVTTDGAYNFGNPVLGVVQNNASNAANVAQHFIFEAPATGSAISSASVTLKVASSGTLGNVLVTLLDNNGNQVAQGTIASSSLTSGTTGIYTVNFSTPVALTAGAGYNLVVTSPGSGSSVVEWQATESDSQTADELATYEGTTGYAFSYASSAYTTAAQTPVLNEDYQFAYTTAPEPNTLNLAFLGFGGLAAIMFFRRKKML